MTEQEYINATNLAKIRAACHLMIDVEINDNEFHNSFIRQARHSLRKLESVYDEMVIIEESE